MNELKIFDDEEVLGLIKLYETAQMKKQEMAYNIISISSYNSYLENFHSDIIASLLNPNGLHKQGPVFLNAFINFLNDKHACNLKLEDFSSAQVHREKGRIDIWIVNNTPNGAAIIIENKINDAPDQEDQLKRYSEYNSIKSFDVKAIVYLSIDGLKVAPWEYELNLKLTNIAAYSEDKEFENNNLVTGWLMKCLDFVDSPDIKSFIFQYIKLLKHLANKSMDIHAMSKFYTFFNNNEKLNQLDNLIKMRESLAAYRAKEFVKAIGDKFKPFKKLERYKTDNYWIFNEFNFEGHILKIDIDWRNDGSVLIRLWEHKPNGIEVIRALLGKLKTNNYFDLNDSSDPLGISRWFRIESQTLEILDKSFLEFVQNLLNEFRELKSAKA